MNNNNNPMPNGGDALPETPVLHDLSFFIESGYGGGYGMSSEQYERWSHEIRERFADGGFSIEECKPATSCCYAVKGLTRLYCHPEVAAGCCQQEHISEVEALLRKGKSFNYRSTSIHRRLYDLTPERELAHYQSQTQEIRSTLLRAFDTDGRNVYKYAREIQELTTTKFRIRTLHNSGVPDNITQAMAVVQQTYRQLLAEGLLEEAPIPVGNFIGIGSRVPLKSKKHE